MPDPLYVKAREILRAIGELRQRSQRDRDDERHDEQTRAGQEQHVGRARLFRQLASIQRRRPEELTPSHHATGAL